MKHYVKKHRYVPLWVLVNYLTIGDLSRMYAMLQKSEKNAIAKYYSTQYKDQYHVDDGPKITSADMTGALKAIVFIRNICAHDEILYDIKFQKMLPITNLKKYFDYHQCDNRKLVVLILYFKMLLNKRYFKQFYSGLIRLFKKYRKAFKVIDFDIVLDAMGVDESELEKLL